MESALGRILNFRVAQPDFGMDREAYWGFGETSTDRPRLERLTDQLAKSPWDRIYGRISHREHAEFRKRYNREADASTYHIAKNELTPRQWTMFERELRQRIVYRHGLLPALLHGTIGRAIGVMSDQRSRLRKIAEEYHRELLKTSRKLEEFVGNEIAQMLGREARGRLKAALGKVPVDLPGAPTLIVLGGGRDGLEKLEQFAKERARAYRLLIGWGDF